MADWEMACADVDHVKREVQPGAVSQVLLCCEPDAGMVSATGAATLPARC